MSRVAKKSKSHPRRLTPSGQMVLTAKRLAPKNIASRLTKLAKATKNSRDYSYCAAIALLLVISGSMTVFSATRPEPYKPSANESRIATDDTLLKQYIEAYGPDKTIAFIKTLPVDCHQRVHKVGRLSYDLNGNKAFTVLNSECMSGYTHGITEAFFIEHGTDNLAESLDIICQGQQVGFYSHQCFHGVGHGLMAYNDYDLPTALKGCDDLPPSGSNKESCFTGVFMENVVGAIAVDEAKANPNPSEFHTSSWLNNDPLYPCNAIDDRYKSSCYIFQTSRMIEIFAYDYQKVAAACESVEVQYRSICFLSMGRDVSNSNGSNYAGIEKSCNFTGNPELSLSCVNGAAQDKFWHESEQDDALGMCKAMQSTIFKQNCYSTLSARASEIIPTKEGSQSFCAKYEPGYTQYCTAKR